MIGLQEEECLSSILNIPRRPDPFSLNPVSAADRSHLDETSQVEIGTYANFLHALNDNALLCGGCPTSLVSVHSCHLGLLHKEPKYAAFKQSAEANCCQIEPKVSALLAYNFSTSAPDI